MAEHLKCQNQILDNPCATKERPEPNVHQILGDMEDSTAVAILALHPSVAQLEEARVWLTERVRSSAKNIARLMVW